jgi:hypothetical protein
MQLAPRVWASFQEQFQGLTADWAETVIAPKLLIRLHIYDKLSHATYFVKV